MTFLHTIVTIFGGCVLLRSVFLSIVFLRCKGDVDRAVGMMIVGESIALGCTIVFASHSSIFHGEMDESVMLTLRIVIFFSAFLTTNYLHRALSREKALRAEDNLAKNRYCNAMLEVINELDERNGGSMGIREPPASDGAGFDKPTG